MNAENARNVTAIRILTIVEVSSAPPDIRELGVNDADLADPADQSAVLLLLLLLVSLVGGRSAWPAVVRQCNGDVAGVTQSTCDVDGGVM